MTLTPLEKAFADNGTYDNHARYFLDRVDRYPWTAMAPTSVSPPVVPGMHMSVRLREGWRAWAFETETERDKFIVQFGGRAFP